MMLYGLQTAFNRNKKTCDALLGQLLSAIACISKNICRPHVRDL